MKLTPEEYAALEQELGTGELRRCIDYVDECAQATNNRNKWKDYSVILTRCSREGWGVQQEKRAQEIPKGASGVLGEAELEAIQLLLKEDNYAGTP